MRIDRRQFVLGAIGSGTISTLLVGCGGGSEPKTGRSAPVNPTSTATGALEEISLTFSETNEFYNELTKALGQKRNVILKFDGEHRVGESSKFLTEFIGHATNWDELLKEIRQKDTQAGRKELQRAFAAELLNHEALKDESRIPNGDVKLPSGEVIEPATVMLVLGILLILAATSVAHAESARGRSYRITTRVSKTGIELHFQAEP
jgi:hypothetical protein